MDGISSSSNLLPSPFSSPNGRFIMADGCGRLPCSPPMKDMLMYPWNWGMGAEKIQLSPSTVSSVCGISPCTFNTDYQISGCALGGESNFGHQKNEDDSFVREQFGSPVTPRRPLHCVHQSVESPVQDESFLTSPSSFLKRGRPRADTISNLIVESSRSPSSIRCKICYRVFPREKSLQAHMRTHTGERPYICDFPGCGRAFCQSGQLKTHQRLHTGERPFKCSNAGCRNRFTHANRHCQAHPGFALVRCESDVLYPSIPQDENNLAVLEWLSRHVDRRKTNGPQRRVKRALHISPAIDLANQDSGVKKLKMDDEVEDVIDSLKTDEEIARPLEHIENDEHDLAETLNLEPILPSEQSEKGSPEQIDNEITCIGNDIEEERETILGALALMELAKNQLSKKVAFRL